MHIGRSASSASLVCVLCRAGLRLSRLIVRGSFVGSDAIVVERASRRLPPNARVQCAMEGVVATKVKEGMTSSHDRPLIDWGYVCHALRTALHDD